MATLTHLLSTGDGTMTVTLLTPDGPGPWPGVVFIPDGFGPRASIFEVAARHAALGYAVAVYDPFYRVGSVRELIPEGGEMSDLIRGVLFDPAVRERWRERFYRSATAPASVATDLTAAVDFLASRPEVSPGPVGLVGYCMGGGIALRAAALLGERIGAAASFHGGMLATDAPDSPHLGAPAIRAAVLVVGAIEDPSFTDAIRDRLIGALSQAGVRHAVETYPARHGFCIPDSPTHDDAQAARHHRAIATFFGQHLGGR